MLLSFTVRCEDCHQLLTIDMLRPILGQFRHAGWAYKDDLAEGPHYCRIHASVVRKEQKIHNGDGRGPSAVAS